MSATREGLLKHLVETTSVGTRKELERAFRVVDRKDFVPEKCADEAYEDYPLSIGFEQTISQPSTVAFMLGLLAVSPGQKVLDVGSGSGWTTALLAELVGKEGMVLGFEIVPGLVLLGQHNLAKYAFPQARIEKAGEELGRKKEGPFDRILISAAAEELSGRLLSQLKVGGILVAPIRDSIVKIVKHKDGSVEREKYPGFAFVPLIDPAQLG